MDLRSSFRDRLNIELSVGRRAAAPFTCRAKSPKDQESKSRTQGPCREPRTVHAWAEPGAKSRGPKSKSHQDQEPMTMQEPRIMLHGVEMIPKE